MFCDVASQPLGALAFATSRNLSFLVFFLGLWLFKLDIVIMQI